MVHPRIERNSDIMFGKPVIKGTRITAELILRKLSTGKTFAEILVAHPHLTIEDLYAAAAIATDYLAQEEIVQACC